VHHDRDWIQIKTLNLTKFERVATKEANTNYRNNCSSSAHKRVSGGRERNILTT